MCDNWRQGRARPFPGRLSWRRLAPQGPQDFYRVMVRTGNNFLERHGETFAIRPGMLAQVDIESGERSVLSYLTRPLLRARLR